MISEDGVIYDEKILALVLLCLLLPACALAQVTITDKDGAMVELPYCLEEAQSPYTMTTNGVHSEKVSISVSDNVELVLNGVQIDTADQAALDVIGDVSGSELVLTLAQGTVNTIRSTDTDPEDDAFSSLRTTVPLTIQGKGVLDVQGDGSTIEMADRSNLTIAGGTVKATGVRGIHTNGGVIYIQGGSLTADATGGGHAIGGPVICAPDIVMVGRNNEVDSWRTCDGEISDYHVRSAEAVKLTLMDGKGGTAWTTTVGKGYEFEIDWWSTDTPEDKVFVGWKTPDGRTIEYGERLTVHEDTKLEPVFGDPLSVIYEQYQGKPFEESGLVPGMMYVVMPYDGKAPEGQVFSHWLTQDGEKLMEFEPVRLTKSLTLTPVFAEAVEITWLVDDYNNMTEVTVFAKGAVCDVIEGVDTEKGVFTGWKVSDVDMTLEAGQRFIADRDLTMIAQFEKKDMVKLTFMDNGVQSAQYMPKGEKNPINKAGEESRGSGEFLYWKDAAGNHYAADALGYGAPCDFRCFTCLHLALPAAGSGPDKLL